MSRNPNVEILRLMLLLETNIGCKKIIANERYKYAAGIVRQWDRHLVPQKVYL